MSSDILYKGKKIFSCSSSDLEFLREAMLSFVKKQKINPQSELVEFISSLEWSQAWELDTSLRSKEEIRSFSKLAEMAINKLIEEDYFEPTQEMVQEYEKYYNEKFVNWRLKNFINFVANLKEIVRQLDLKGQTKL